jgi:hypothetical protein
MWEPQPLTTLRASKACRGENFTFKKLGKSHLCVFSHTVKQHCILAFPRGSGVKYLHRSPTSHRKWQKGKSRIWDSKIWSRVPRTQTWEWMRWQRTAAIVNYRPIISSERMLYKDYGHRCSIEKKKFWPWVSRGSAPRQTDWRYTASRKVTLTLTVPLTVSWLLSWLLVYGDGS